jgi:hypothetical protein
LTETIFLYGTPQPPAPRRSLNCGALNAVIEAGALRAISLGPVELVRQIDFPVRDENWASLPPTTLDESLHETDDEIRYTHSFEVANGALQCRVTYTLSRSSNDTGTITAHGTATATRDFTTNRTGFSLLHPLEHVAGRPVTVRHTSGATADMQMPDLISPDQPIKDIAGLAFAPNGIALDIAFEGEIFEMEDQRNWSDASFKTYCRPLIEPFAYTIKAGETLSQTITVTAAGTPPRAQVSAPKPIQLGTDAPEPLPQLSLALQKGWMIEDHNASANLLRGSGIAQFTLRITPQTASELIPIATGYTSINNPALDLEIVLDDDAPAAAQLDRIAALCRDTGLAPEHVTALPTAFLASYQPSSQWPTGLQPADCIAAARSAFPNAKIGAGMLTNFTEFNRCRPAGTDHDFITHGNSATVHAADDTSVMQTLEALPHIFRSARAIGGAKPYRLGLTAIGMRSNPYGAATTPNPDQNRLTMTVYDPRARALFGAAWALGALAATQGHSVAALTLAAPCGPFGIINHASEVARPWYDDHPNAKVTPLYHVLHALRDAGPRLPVSNLPSGFAAVAVQTKADSAAPATRLIIANLTDTPRAISLPAGKLACLDATSFNSAAQDPEWSSGAVHNAPMTPAGTQSLAPYALLFADLK